jgi:glucan phosphorylase
MFLRTKKNRPAGRFFSQADITSKQLEQQQPKRLAKQQQQRQQQPKQLAKRQQQRQQLELVLEQLLEQQLLEQLLELEQQELLLFSSKQPEQQPAGRRSAGIFSWIFLS